MPTVQTELEALLEMGDDLVDAEKFVAEGRKLASGQAPGGIDVLRAESGYEVTEADILDARTDWYTSDAVPPQWKRLLDAEKQGET